MDERVLVAQDEIRSVYAGCHVSLARQTVNVTAT
jgi:hypothetical protein